jgi:hypothetical protein
MDKLDRIFRTELIYIAEHDNMYHMKEYYRAVVNAHSILMKWSKLDSSLKGYLYPYFRTFADLYNIEAGSIKSSTKNI